MKSGIYVIKNIVTGAEYVGSSKCFEARWKQHKKTLRSQTHCNPYLQRSWNLHGEEAFNFEIIEETTDLYNRELFWIHERKPLYNCRTAKVRNSGNGMMFDVSAETRKKMSIAHSKVIVSAETRRKKSLLRAGKPLSESHRQSIINAKREHPQVFTEETRIKISNAQKGKHQSYESRQAKSRAMKGKPLTEEHRLKLLHARHARMKLPISFRTWRELSYSFPAVYWGIEP
jgi:group I intron endonuclease